MKIGITGASGMIGWHLRCHLKQYPEFTVCEVGRETLHQSGALAEFVADLDVVIHLAGQNRGDKSDISRVNPKLAQCLIEACELSGALPHIVYSSSTHAAGDSAYGQSKRKAGELIAAWADKNGARFTNMILPHVFGERTRPNYNSVVATFAHALATGRKAQVTHDAELELVHAQDVCAQILQVLQNGVTGELRIEGRRIRVSEVLKKLQGIASNYQSDIIPDLSCEFDLRLFNLYRSYLFPEFYPRGLTLHSDDRGVLFEAIKADNGGQAFFSTTEPGITRGNHFHFRKVERFLVVDGCATIRIRRLFDDVVHSFDVNGDEPAIIDMPTLHTHNITNTSDKRLLTIFWSNEIFDPDRPDTISESV